MPGTRAGLDTCDEEGLAEHEMRGNHPEYPSRDLDGDVENGVARSDLAPYREGERHRRVEVRPGNRPEDQDEHDQRRPRGNGVPEQRDGVVSSGKALSHDAASDDDGEQERGAEGFGGEPAREIVSVHTGSSGFRSPISSSLFWSASLSSAANGRLTKMPMRLFSMR